MVSGKGAEIKVGNALLLSDIPLGSFMHNIEIRAGQEPGSRGSAGASVQLVAKDEKIRAGKTFFRRGKAYSFRMHGDNRTGQQC